METKNEKPKKSNKKFTIVGYIGEVYEIEINEDLKQLKNEIINIHRGFKPKTVQKCVEKYFEFKDKLKQYSGKQGLDIDCKLVFPGCLAIISAKWGVNTTLISVLPELHADQIISTIEKGEETCLSMSTSTTSTLKPMPNFNYCIGIIKDNINIPTVIWDAIIYYPRGKRRKCHNEYVFKPRKTFINELIEGEIKKNRENEAYIDRCILKYGQTILQIHDNTKLKEALSAIVRESDVIFTFLAGYKLPQIYVDNLKDSVILVFAPMRYEDFGEVNNTIMKIIDQKGKDMYKQIYVVWDTNSITIHYRETKVPEYISILKNQKVCIEKSQCISLTQKKNYNEFMEMWYDIKNKYLHIWNSNIVFLHALFELDGCVDNVKFVWKKANQNEINVYYGPINVRNVDPEWEKLIKELIPGNDEELFALETIYAKEVLSQQDSRFKKDEEALKFGITAVVYRIIHRQTVDLPIKDLLDTMGKIFPSNFNNYVKKIKII